MPFPYPSPSEEGYTLTPCHDNSCSNVRAQILKVKYAILVNKPALYAVMQCSNRDSRLESLDSNNGKKLDTFCLQIRKDD